MLKTFIAHRHKNAGQIWPMGRSLPTRGLDDRNPCGLQYIVTDRRKIHIALENKVSCCFHVFLILFTDED